MQDRLVVDEVAQAVVGVVRRRRGRQVQVGLGKRREAATDALAVLGSAGPAVADALLQGTRGVLPPEAEVAAVPQVMWK